MRVKDEGKRLAIYHAALKLVTSEGLARASMAKIAKEAGVSPATLYVYFENKEDMLNKLYLMVKEESAVSIMKDLSGGMDCREGIYSYMRNLFAFMVENPLHFSFHEQFLNSPDIKAETREQGMALYAPLIKLYKEGLKTKQIRDFPMELLGAFMFAPIFSLIKSHLNGELEITDDLLEKAIDMAWSAVKT